jgi:hypothetical protein
MIFLSYLEEIFAIYMRLQMFGTLGRATVPADTGRHGGRPYDSTRSKVLSRFDRAFFLAGGGAEH